MPWTRKCAVLKSKAQTPKGLKLNSRWSKTPGSETSTTPHPEGVPEFTNGIHIRQPIRPHHLCYPGQSPNDFRTLAPRFAQLHWRNRSRARRKINDYWRRCRPCSSAGKPKDDAHDFGFCTRNQEVIFDVVEGAVCRFQLARRIWGAECQCLRYTRIDHVHRQSSRAPQKRFVCRRIARDFGGIRN